MSIASEITRIKNNIASAYTYASNKGATMPEVQNSANLPATIDSITGGTETSTATLVKLLDTVYAINYGYPYNILAESDYTEGNILAVENKLDKLINGGVI